MTLMKWSLLFALIVGLYSLSCTSAPPAPDAPLTSGGKIHGARARTLVQSGALLLDVRTPAEFASGHVEGALNIPVQALEQRMSELPKTKQIIVYCRSGRRSAAATALIHKAQLGPVYDLGPMSAYPHQ